MNLLSSTKKTFPNRALLYCRVSILKAKNNKVRQKSQGSPIHLAITPQQLGQAFN